MSLCRTCGKPFVNAERIACVVREREIRHSICIECRQNMGAQAEVEMDCVDYLRSGGDAKSFWRRLRDGSELLGTPD
jgi:deoxycytidylate deaminase